MVIIEQIYINKFLDTKVTLFVCKNILKDENNIIFVEIKI